MTPEQKIRRAVIEQAAEMTGYVVPEVTALNVDELYDSQPDGFDDALSEMREGEIETELPCEWSRHYEAKSVAARMSDGSWVGWTYWYGGGKHGEPESIDWMKEAYELSCTEKEVLMTVRTFEKKPTSSPAPRRRF